MNIGTIKVRISRLREYLGWFQFIMIFIIFVNESKINPILLLMGLLGVSAILDYIDSKKILPQEHVYHFNKNPYFVELRKDVKDIKAGLNLDNTVFPEK